MQAEEKVYKFTGNVNFPCYAHFDSESVDQLKKWYDNQMIIERLRPVDNAKIKQMISATLFNLKLHRLAGGF